MKLVPQQYTETLIPSLLNGVFQDFDSLMPYWAGEPLVEQKVFPVDVEETDSTYVVTADVPGISKENVDIVQEKDAVTIKIARAVQPDKDSQKFLVRERCSYSVARTLRLNHLKPDGCEANLKDGLLTLKLSKDENVMPKKIAISAG